MLQTAYTEKGNRPWQAVLQWLTFIFEGKKQKSTIAALDGVRAIACFMVIAYHLSLITTNDVALWVPTQFPALLDSLAFFGDTGVTLFFVLSGFLLFLPYARALLFDAPWPSLRQFYLRRVLRILPAYYVSLFLMMVIYHPEYLHRNHIKQLILFFTLFLDSSPLTFKQINGPFWTLAVEWQFYLLLPFLAYGIRLIVRHGHLVRRILLLAISLIAVICWGLFTRYIGVYVTDHPGTTFHLPPQVLHLFLFFTYGVPNAGLHGKFLEDFAVGMMVSSAYLLLRSVPSESRYATLAQKCSPWIFLIGLGWLYSVAIWKYDDRTPHTWPLLDRLLPYYPSFSELCFSIGFGLCVFAILLGPHQLKRIFEWRLLRWLGLLSFGLYMWHLLLLVAWSQIAVKALYQAQWPHLALYLSYWLWLFVFILPCIFLLFVCVEKPFMQLGERFRGKTSTRSVTEADNVRHSSQLATATIPDTENAPGLIQVAMDSGQAAILEDAAGARES